jgi:ferredoxin
MSCRLHLRGASLLYIQPDECIDCAACERSVGPVFTEDDIPGEWKPHDGERRVLRDTV